MDKKLYIGNKRVQMTSDDKDNTDIIVVTLEDGKQVKLKKKLFNLIAKEAKGNGTVTDAAYAYIAQEFVFEMAQYGLERYEIEHVAKGIGTLVHNLTEIKIGEAFGCDSSQRIKLEDIIKS